MNRMSNELNDLSQVSCEETFTADMGTADWANDFDLPSVSLPCPPPMPKCPCCEDDLEAAFDNWDKLAAKVLKQIDEFHKLDINKKS
jgi:hypothetical protein